MGLLRALRRSPSPLGEGVWRRVHDRFRRAVDRYHQVIEGVLDGPARDELEAGGARLAAALDVVHAACATAQRDAPSAGLEIPRGDDGTHQDLHRDLSRAAGLVAQAAEAATMVRAAPTETSRLVAVDRAIHRVESLVAATASADRSDAPPGSAPPEPRAWPGTSPGRPDAAAPRR